MPVDVTTGAAGELYVVEPFRLLQPAHRPLYPRHRSR